MIRKVVKLGPSTMVVSLPSTWTKKLSITAGDEVEVNEVSEGLLLTTQSKTSKEATIKLEQGNTREIYIKLSHVYRMGFDKIVIILNNRSSLKHIAKIVTSHLLGMEITSKSDKKCVVENITEPTDQKFSVLLRRVFLQIIETQNLIAEDFSRKKSENWEEIKSLRISLDRYVFFCRRVISKHMNTDSYALLHWELLTFLMHIHHANYYMYEYYQKKKIISANTITILEKVNGLFTHYYDSYFKRNERDVNFIETNKAKIEEEVIRLLESGKEAVILSYIKEISRLIQIGSSPIRAILITETQKEKEGSSKSFSNVSQF
jgi:phosphate uptake regulator